MVLATFVTFAAFVVFAAFMTFFATFVVFAAAFSSFLAASAFACLVLAAFGCTFLGAVFAVCCCTGRILTIVFRCHHILLFGSVFYYGIVVFRSCVVVA